MSSSLPPCACVCTAGFLEASGGPPARACGAQAQAARTRALAPRLVHSEHPPAKGGQRGRLRGRVGSADARGAWKHGAPGLVSTRCRRCRAEGRPRGAGCRARATQTASGPPRTCASRQPRAPAPRRERLGRRDAPGHAPQATRNRRTAGRQSAAGLQRHVSGGGRRACARNRAPDSRNCSRVCGRYQHASANGDCATSVTCVCRLVSTACSTGAAGAAAPSGCARR